ncbi:MAG: phenylalanine--tRNA ligase subunit beta [Planctomycetes bacterium]|nr:phenylalanine--tRNA ligase subunit beta [Planctomycetota bacterium]
MIVSWEWLSQYVRLDMSVEELTSRLTMAGLNLEEVSEVDGDTAIDLEVTSNRPDCLGHIGVAREVSVLFGRELRVPEAAVSTVPEKTADVTSVRIDCEDLCPRYFARVIRGVKVGPSPDWLARRLRTLGIATINNVVDVTNYVLMECGQPLHAFDFDKLHERRIVVRRARPGETIVAINQRQYELTPEMCIIADADRPVAIGGVMGGLETEISQTTTNVLIETAQFDPVSIRTTARRLALHSDSSYRFERGVDPEQLDWASRRCCELILEVAGGELLDEPVFAGRPIQPQRPAIPLRFAQIARILGIEVPRNEAIRILKALGLTLVDEPTAERAAFVAPSWRRDLTREADLIEEVARIYGYDKIPEDAPVPLELSEKTHRDRITDRVRDVLVAAGFFEAISMSFVSRELFQTFVPYPDRQPLSVDHSSRRQENLLRQSLIPSLLQLRRDNERHGNANAELFEVADVYLAAVPGDGEAEPRMIGLVAGRPFVDVKGVVEAIAAAVNREAVVTLQPSRIAQFAPGRGADVLLNGEPWGWLGEIASDVADRLDLQNTPVVAELRLDVLERHSQLVPTYQELPRYPAVPRDLNFVLDETVTWAQLESVVREAAGPLLDRVGFGGEYRGKQLPAGKKSYLVRLSYRSPDRTLTNEEVEQMQQAVIRACEQKLAAQLRA